LHFRPTSADSPGARRPILKTRPTLFSTPDSSPHSATLQHVQTREPFFSPGSHRTFEKPRHAFQKSRPQGLITLSTASALSPSEASFSFPRSWVSPSRAFLRPCGPHVVSHARSALALSCQPHRVGTDATTVSARMASRASRAPPLLRVEWSRCSPGLFTFRACFRQTREEVSLFLAPPHVLSLPGLRRNRGAEPQGA